MLGKFIINEISPLGYGNPNGISLDKKMKSGICGEVDIEFAVKIIKSGICMHKITKNDCGCIDGRRAEEVHFVNEDGDDTFNETDTLSIHERYKVAGGGYITAIGMLAGTNKLSSHVDNDMSIVMDNLSKDGIYCGTHDGPHSHGEKSDCGANDNMRLIFENGVKHREAIKSSIVGLLDVAGANVDEFMIDNLFDCWNKVAENDEYFHQSSGASRFEMIKDSINSATRNQKDSNVPLAVSKKLAGDHQESFIIINYCNGMTFSQPTFRHELAKEFPDKHIDCHTQAFVVDVPRIEEIAKSVSENTSADYMQTLSAGIAYQLATAATLTDGSLRTFIVKFND